MTEAQRQRAKQVISERADDFGADQLALDHQLREHLGMDSCQRLILTLDLEEEFGFEFDDAAVETLCRPETTVQDVLQAVERRLPTKANA